MTPAVEAEPSSVRTSPSARVYGPPASAVGVGTTATTCCRSSELCSKPPVAAKVAVIGWLPAVRVLVVRVAVPSPASGMGEPRADPPSRNWTAPVVTGAPSDVTVAVIVTDWPTVDGFGAEVSVVVVGLVVMTVRHHPPAIEPASPDASSSTHRLQVPLGAEPLNVDNASAALGFGAGAGNTSVPSVSSSVGLKVPLVRGFGTEPAASSSKPTVERADRRRSAGIAEQHDVGGRRRAGQ